MERIVVAILLFLVTACNDMESDRAGAAISATEKLTYSYDERAEVCYSWSDGEVKNHVVVECTVAVRRAAAHDLILSKRDVALR